MIYGVRQTVALLLIAFGSLLTLLGVTSLFVQPPGGVSAQTDRLWFSCVMVGAALGLGLIAWGAYLRATLSRPGRWPIWVVYVILLTPLIGLAVFVGGEVIDIVRDGASPRELGRAVTGTILLLGFLFGPILLLFRRPRATEDRQQTGQQEATGPDGAPDRPRE